VIGASPNLASAASTAHDFPKLGQTVRIRTRTYVVEAVEEDPISPDLAVVRGACLDDDAQGEPLEVVWGLELDTEILDQEAWMTLGDKGFDEPRFFGAFLHTLRWNCVTATDPNLFQAPFRAGIRIDAYQLEPLRKALRLPRVNLFIADDVGLGKTIEAGLIASELLLRRRAREIVVACPPSMLYQWKDELETRFGLTFEILDRAYVERIRQERGYGVNPWTTFPRFLISHRLLIDESYAGPLRDWLDNLHSGSLFIFDEAHHAAPASGSRYAIDSRFTRAIRDLAPRFEHRLFLSATPHNGHSNSFSALLEILDPHRFTRGVKVLKSRLDDAMVRRLKEDIRAIGGGFPKRNVVQVDLSGLSADTPELRLSQLLEDYRAAREVRYADATRRQQAEAALLVSGLQQRLMSSIEAFARTLKVHRQTMERHWAGEAAASPPGSAVRAALDLWTATPDADDERSQQDEDDQTREADAAVETATLATAGDHTQSNIATERALLEEMTAIAEAARGQPDARARHLIDWVRTHLCPGARLPGQPSPDPDAPWTDLRLLIFTEYEDTKRYLVGMLRAAIAGTPMAEHRIEVFHGPTPPEKREAIKRAFNQSPAEHPVRILVATDAAREGLNLQAHCWNLFHFDVPWNPARLEQRNGRIDRKLQPSPEVYCHYFVYLQRPEDRVLQALVRKTETISHELGSLSPVISNRLASALKPGIRRRDAERIAQEIDAAGLEADKQATIDEELEAARERQDALRKQIDTLRGRINSARKWIGLENDAFRDALSCSLEMLGAEPLQPTETPRGEPHRWTFPNLEARRGADPTWSGTLDTLRALPDDGQRGFAWRKQSPIRPVVFSAPEGIDDDVVQLHLEHRVVQRLLGRFLSQGFVHHDLSRACLAQSEDAVPRIILLGRLSLYGRGAVRLHEELIPIAARWVEPELRAKGLTPYARDTESRTLELLEKALLPNPDAGSQVSGFVRERLLGAIAQDIEELLPFLEARGQLARDEAEKRLLTRGHTESDSLTNILEDQRRRVAEALGKPIQMSLDLGDTPEEIHQAESNRRYWERWLDNVAQELEREPERIIEFYTPASHRIEPVGIAYLWPVTG